MKFILPRGYVVDTEDVPETFEDDIRHIFEKYTEGTADAYTFQDKLCFLDVCVNAFHGGKDEDDAVEEYLVNRMKYDLENGEFPQQEDYFDIDTFTDAYKLGKESQRMYSHDFGNRHQEEAIEKLIIRIIKVLFCEPDVKITMNGNNNTQIGYVHSMTV